MTDVISQPDAIIAPETLVAAQGVIEHGLIQTVSSWLVDFVHHLGYSGVFIMTFLESTFVPIPAELTMIPAGYLAYEGKMNVILLLLISVAGTVAGSYFNYWLAKHYGRRFLLAYGKYMLIKPERLDTIERYFANHGQISILTGRLIPGLRHFISFPAGLARMDVGKFCFYTALGGGTWMAILITLGYLIGNNEKMLHRYVPLISYSILISIAVVISVYVWHHRRKMKGNTNGVA